MSFLMRVLSGALITVGFLSMIGFVVGIPVVRGIGFASVASPLPLVFSEFRGVENFAAEFDIELVDEHGNRQDLRMTGELYGRLKGPYPRRNPYGAVVAYGPMLTEPNEVAMRDSILRYGICEHGPLATEIGIDERIVAGTVTFRAKTATRERSWSLPFECAGSVGEP